MVKCLYCGEYFDRLAEPFVKLGNRYAHKACCEKQDPEVVEEEKNKNAFFQYIKKIYGEDYNYISISKQAEKYIKDYSFTYGGMLKSLQWFYDIQHNKTVSEGIGIIPYIYEEAKKYYYELYLAKERNKNIKDYKLTVKEIVIPSPRVPKPPIKLFDLGDED